MVTRFSNMKTTEKYGTRSLPKPQHNLGILLNCVFPHSGPGQLPGCGTEADTLPDLHMGWIITGDNPFPEDWKKDQGRGGKP